MDVEENAKGKTKPGERKIACDPKDPEYIDHLLKSIDKNVFDPYLT